ncbi:NEDD8-activating enzyme E1 regulatory subunit-like isoform X2 [Tubulanus polymorphus]|uniref:NEDD8-activating enzyme E1 regulatory subunit-like isoform X2 n=1 Tax=Tubulanus polymorphus TaxID=672921 RepID=UPI003DA5BBCA
MSQVKKSGLDKNNKYDRQLRLWGDHGQAALEQARVCLINASATGTEILKNLILPGIGAFTIVDGHKITGEDVGNNFFLDKDSIGKSRAQVAMTNLQELNEDVSGDFVEESVEQLLEKLDNPDFFLTFSCVIATDLAEKTLLSLANYLWDHNIPLLVCRSYGMIGYLRLAVKEHTVIESHPDSAFEDLRLDRPFPGLVDYCCSQNLESMSKKDHSHTPWLVILYQYLNKWKNEHGGRAPQNYREKTAFKELLHNGKLRNEYGVEEEEENWDEAIKAVNTALVSTKIPDEVKQVFNDESCSNIHPDSSPFWIVARAIKEFVEKEGEGALPLRGSIPDMTADSERYVQLQGVYRCQAAQEAAIVTDKVHHILLRIGKPLDQISENYIKMFCKNAAFLRVVRCRPLSEEHNPQLAKVADIAMHLEDCENSDGIFYVLMRGVDRFHVEYNRYPGYYEDQVETDVSNLKSCVYKVLQEWGLPPNIKDDYIHEICRYGASELHSVAAFIGGVAAQEVIKIVTEQFIPIKNTFIYNAMKQTSCTLDL